MMVLLLLLSLNTFFATSVALHWFHCTPEWQPILNSNTIQFSSYSSIESIHIQLKSFQTYLFTAKRISFTTLCYYEWQNVHSYLLNCAVFYQLVINSFFSSRYFRSHWFHNSIRVCFFCTTIQCHWCDFRSFFCCCFAFVKHFPTVNNEFSCIVMLPHLKSLYHFMWLTIRELELESVGFYRCFNEILIPFVFGRVGSSSSSRRKKIEMKWMS